ncbi:hypothetical protein EJ08DRAFT_651101 [Tothia fuscella]|uniref:Uncharacterized protein n=1 Tax=Tothia fuscella TaxID=1048955 RepID=A0A9P4NNC6_9PEZI|nr:hypothetical protein EJ08DRAFT_651101 [Tothia fuscella]
MTTPTGTTLRGHPLRQEWMQVKNIINTNVGSAAIIAAIQTETIARTAIKYIIDLKDLLDEAQLVQRLSPTMATPIINLTPEQQALKYALQQKRQAIQRVWEFNERHLDTLDSFRDWSGGAQQRQQVFTGQMAQLLTQPAQNPRPASNFESFFYWMMGGKTNLNHMKEELGKMLHDLFVQQLMMAGDNAPTVLPIVLNPQNP